MLQFPEAFYNIIHLDAESIYTNGFSVNRPCGDKRLYKSITDAAQLGNFICFFPEGNAYVLNDLTFDHFQKKMKEVFNEGSLDYEIISSCERFLH
jgi:hypothetical protein